MRKFLPFTIQQTYPFAGDLKSSADHLFKSFHSFIFGHLQCELTPGRGTDVYAPHICSGPVRDGCNAMRWRRGCTTLCRVIGRVYTASSGCTGCVHFLACVRFHVGLCQGVTWSHRPTRPDIIGLIKRLCWYLGSKVTALYLNLKIKQARLLCEYNLCIDVDDWANFSFVL